MHARAIVVASALSALLSLAPGDPPGASSADGGQVGPSIAAAGSQPAPGRILAPAGRQAAWIDLGAPRPRPITVLKPPSYVSDVAVAATREVALVVKAPFGGKAELGGDLFLLDLQSAATVPLVSRRDATESLGAPSWNADGTALVYERAHMISNQAMQSYPTQIETAQSDGSAQHVLVADGRQPTLSADDTLLAYVRSSTQGSALLIRGMDAAASERELVPASPGEDLAYPRFSPDGSQIAFMATVPFVYGSKPVAFGFLLAGVAYAHGVPWDLWLVNTDGSNLQVQAHLMADDASVAWSPDGRQLFVYGGSGSFLVDAVSGEVVSYGYVSGYGATAWFDN